MKYWWLWCSAVCLLASSALAGAEGRTGDLSAQSPDGRNAISLSVGKTISYSVSRDKKLLLAPVEIGMVCPQKPMGDFPKVRSVQRLSRSGKRLLTVGKKKFIDLAGNETFVEFDSGWAIRLVARDDGVAYRFESSFDDRVVVMDEAGGVLCVEDGVRAFVNYDRGGWKEGNDHLQDSWEALTRVQPFEEIATTNNVAYLPLVLECRDGTTVCVSETDLFDYPGWLLQRDKGAGRAPLRSVFSRWPKKTINVNWRETDDSSSLPLRYKRVTEREDHLVETEGTRTYPWRVFAVVPRAVDLCASEIVDALSSPPQDDFAWVKPGLCAWDWWCAWECQGREKGCTTATYRRFIDFAATNSLPYVVVDAGWSSGTAYLDIWSNNPSVDLPYLIGYAKERNVGLIVWMASGQVMGREARVAEHFGRLGVKGFKVDFIDREDAEAVRFTERFAAECAKRRLVVDYHGMSKPAGLTSKYPNVLNYEGVHGLENLKFGHCHVDFMLNDLMQFYVRMSAGPMDYTPGAMDNYPNGGYKGTTQNPGSLGTRCHQLALMSLYLAPLQMLCDAPMKYEANRECLDYMRQVPTVWDDTVAVDGEPTEFAVAARRSGDAWWCSGICSWNGKSYTLEPKFLSEGEWIADIFEDADDAAQFPTHYVHKRLRVTNASRIPLTMAPGGGFAIRFVLACGRSCSPRVAALDSSAWKVSQWLSAKDAPVYDGPTDNIPTGCPSRTTNRATAAPM